MHARRTTPILAALSLLAGCANSAPTGAPMQQDVEFVRGCWVQKAEPGGRIEAFLRLLPDRQDGSTYEGELSYVLGAKPGEPVHISIARDGASASTAGSGMEMNLSAPPVRPDSIPDDSKRIAFVRAPAMDGMFVEGKPDRIRVSIFSGAKTLVFDGERDGCD